MPRNQSQTVTVPISAAVAGTLLAALSTTIDRYKVKLKEAGEYGPLGVILGAEIQDDLNAAVDFAEQLRVAANTTWSDDPAEADREQREDKMNFTVDLDYVSDPEVIKARIAKRRAQRAFNDEDVSGLPEGVPAH